MEKLTERQKRFVDFYIELGNATEAAIRAGYSKKAAKTTGAQNMAKRYLRAAIDARLSEIEEKRIADASEVMRYLTSVMRGEEKDEVPLGRGEGVQALTEKRTDARDRLRAAELLGKRYLMFTEKVQATIAREVEDLTPLAEMLRYDDDSGSD